MSTDRSVSSHNESVTVTTESNATKKDDGHKIPQNLPTSVRKDSSWKKT